MGWKHALWIGVAMLACGCQGQGKEADAATDQFYKRVAAKDYKAIYADAAPEFQTSMPVDLFVGMMDRIDRRLGACKAPVKIMNFRVNATTSGYFRDQGYTRACANGQLSETVTVVVRGNVAKIAGYWAKSPLLLTD